MIHLGHDMMFGLKIKKPMYYHMEQPTEHDKKSCTPQTLILLGVSKAVQRNSGPAKFRPTMDKHYVILM